MTSPYAGMMMPVQGPPGLTDEPDFLAGGQQDVLSGRPGGPFGGWWRIIWCHERCHKQQNDDLRHTVRKVAQFYGASLICLKKSRQFAVWMERAPRPPYVLVTDWREAQPSIQAISQQEAQKRPMMTIVLCDSKRQLLRASDWARTVPPELGRVQVCERSNIPPSLLGGLIHTCFGSSDGPEMMKNVPQMPSQSPGAFGLSNLPAVMPNAPCSFGGGANPLDAEPRRCSLSELLDDTIGSAKQASEEEPKVDLGEPMYCVSSLAKAPAWSLFDEQLQEKKLGLGCGSTDGGSTGVIDDAYPSEEESLASSSSNGQAVCQTLWKQSCLLATAMGEGRAS